MSYLKILFPALMVAGALGSLIVNLEYTVLYWTHQRSKASITQKHPNVLMGKEKRQEGKRFASFR